MTVKRHSRGKKIYMLEREECLCGLEKGKEESPASSTFGRVSGKDE